MADARLAIDNTLKFEDSTLSGKVTVDKGGRTRFGIAEKFNPDMPSGFYDGSLPRELALQFAEAKLKDRYWNPLYSLINSQLVANKLFDMGVNEGPRSAVKMLQRELELLVDGIFGQHTLLAVNEEDELDLLHCLRSHWCRVKREEVEADPSQDRFLNGWLRRAAA